MARLAVLATLLLVAAAAISSAHGGRAREAGIGVQRVIMPASASPAEPPSSGDFVGVPAFEEPSDFDMPTFEEAAAAYRREADDDEEKVPIFGP